MKPTATRLIKITAFMSICGSVAYVSYVVGQEVAYVHGKVNGSTSTDTIRQELRWPEAVALPELRASPLKTNYQVRTEN